MCASVQCVSVCSVYLCAQCISEMGKMVTDILTDDVFPVLGFDHIFVCVYIFIDI